MESSKTRAVLLFLLALTFGVLIFGGYIIHKEKPPIPIRVVVTDGQVILTHDDILNGQNFYFSRGGQHIGTIWGHGSYMKSENKSRIPGLKSEPVSHCRFTAGEKGSYITIG